jgi:hypothetical protein
MTKWLMEENSNWIPACAGMTIKQMAIKKPVYAGMTLTGKGKKRLDSGPD